MDRIYSACLQHELTPWLDNEDEPNLIPHLIPTPNPLPHTSKKLPPPLPNKSQITKFHKIMQQHRVRIRGNKAANTKSMEIIEKDSNYKYMTVNQEIREGHGKYQEEEGEDGEGEGERKMYARSYTAVKFAGVQLSSMKSFNPMIKDNSEHEKQIIQAYYRMKHGNRNADKFYGSLNKKPQLLPPRPKFSSTILLSKNDLPPNHLSSSKITTLFSKTNPMKSIIQIKLPKYCPSKCIEKLNLFPKSKPKTSTSSMSNKYKYQSTSTSTAAQSQGKGKGKRKGSCGIGGKEGKDGEEHVLDRILVRL